MKKEKCYICEKGFLENKKVDFSLYGTNLGKFDAQVCSVCGEKFFDEKASDEIDDKAKEKGLWGLEADTKVTKTGSSMAVTISKKIGDFMCLEKGKRVHLRPENKNRLVVEIV
ncbi:YgiT-type zinc finger protein [Candidatus Woesearchaeota archaeon]|nr:YgiT-type zinc finger protein [Candidatus Woesearchaeota archaeon]